MYLQLLLIFIGIVLCQKEILKIVRLLESLQKDLNDLREELENIRIENKKLHQEIKAKNES